MNRKQANAYIREAMILKVDAIQGVLSKDWPEEYKSHFAAFPKLLFKYSKVNSYTLDAIRNEYIYLCPAIDLDDQFECRVDFPTEDDAANSEIISEEFIDALAEMIEEYPSSFSKKDLKALIRKALDKDRRFDFGQVNLMLDQEADSISEEQKGETIKCFGALMTGAWMSEGNEALLKDLTIKAAKAKNEIGIGSLTENGKSQVMWEMYGDHYQGVCIEFDLSHDVNALVNTFPVIYGDKKRSKILHILVGICLDALMTSLSKSEKPWVENSREYIKLFLTKYSEWAFQKEWRVIGEAGLKFHTKSIKALYLGKKVSEDDERQLIAIAKEKGFRVYRQKDNFESLSLEYEQIL